MLRGVSSCQEMAEKSDTVEIIVDEKTYLYSMEVAPPEDSLLVKQEKEDLLGALDLESFVQDLGRVGKYIRVAYNGIGAAGPKFQDLQIQVQRLGFGISKLCDKSATMIASFKTTTWEILFELRAAYQLLLDSSECFALEAYSYIAELAGKMAKAAENLQKDFEAEEFKVLETLEETHYRRAREKIKISELRQHQEKAEVNMKRKEELAKEHEKLEAEFRAQRRDYEAKEDEVLSSATSSLERLGNVITSTVGLGNLFSDDSEREAKAKQWRQKYLEKLENEREQRKLKQEALQSMAELVHEIKSSKDDENLANVAVEALCKTSASMKLLISLLRRTVLFWNQLKEHCEMLGDDRLQHRIERFVEKFPAKKRRDYWTSNAFKVRMFLYYSKWVALHSISSACFEIIKLTQRDVYDYIIENPTYEESRLRLQDLVRDFEKDLEIARKKIEDQTILADRELRKLQAIKSSGKL